MKIHVALFDDVVKADPNFCPLGDRKFFGLNELELLSKHMEWINCWQFREDQAGCCSREDGGWGGIKDSGAFCTGRLHLHQIMLRGECTFESDDINIQ